MSAIDAAARTEAKRRGLDMRHVYEFRGGALCKLSKWTSGCSGCSCEWHDGQCSCPSGGCFECGYTGKRREAMFLPVSGADAELLLTVNA